MRIVIQNADFSSVKIGTEIGDVLTSSSVQNRAFLIPSGVSFGASDVYDLYCFDISNYTKIAIKNGAATSQSSGIIALFCTGEIPPSKSWPNGTGAAAWVAQYMLNPKSTIVPSGWTSDVINRSEFEEFNVPANVTRVYVCNKNNYEGAPLKVYGVE